MYNVRNIIYKIVFTPSPFGTGHGPSYSPGIAITEIGIYVQDYIGAK